jgi:hypothetical protein
MQASTFALGLAVGTTVAACVDLRAAAVATYVETSRCEGTPPVARERPDLADDGRARYEVTGCGPPLVLVCSASYGKGGGVRVSCGRSGQCGEPGCDSYEAAARDAFVVDQTCPLRRTTAALHAPVSAAPADVAADPERLRLWNDTHRPSVAPERARAYVMARGCGRETVYACWKPDATLAIPICEAVL